MQQELGNREIQQELQDLEEKHVYEQTRIKDDF